MEELLINTRPIMIGLVGIAVLYYNYRNTKKQWNKRAPKRLTHPLIRIVLAGLIFTGVAFVFSGYLTTNLTYALINTVILVTLFLLYLSKVTTDVKKFHSQL